MPPLRQIKSNDLIKALKKAGFVPRFGKGSHVVLEHSDGCVTVVPQHTKPLGVGVVKAALRQTKLTVDDLLQLLR